jgi:hypothetical protein
MSWVTNVMVSVDGVDNDNVMEFSRWLTEDCPRRDQANSRTGCGGLVLITGTDTTWGGPKYPECYVYAGVLNHADLNAVVEHFGRIRWREPNAAQLFVMDQEESFFRLWMIRDGDLRQYAPTSPTENDDGFWHTDVEG